MSAGGRHRLRVAALQGLGLGVTAALLWWLARNTIASLDEEGLALGFDFLRQPAGFDIGESWVHFSPADSFARAIAVGLANTAVVSALGWVLSIALGFLLGVLRLADNAPLRGLVRACVELMRNTPLLLLLLFLAATIHALPAAREALHVGGVILSDRGLVLPRPQLVPLGLERPRFDGFNFVGGITISPEMAALLAGLVLHHAAHISEVVRGAILAVPRGQRDAARALGLSQVQELRFVVVPQALRAMVPLLATNCVSLTKNSSLAVAIGFPDVVSILNTTANQTGHSIETMVIMIALYLALSLIVAAALNVYNARLLRRGFVLR